jgi:hypothetical protein
MLLAAIGDILLLVNQLNDGNAASGVARGFSLLYDVILIAGLATAGFAFFGGSQGRARRLRIALGLVAGAFTALLTSNVILAVQSVTDHDSGTSISYFVVSAVSALLIMVAAVLAAFAFVAAVTALGAEIRAQQNSRLGRASIFFALGIAAAMASSILFTVLFADAGITGGFTVGYGIDAGGLAIAIGASVVATAALLRAKLRIEQGQLGWLPQRDGLLGISAAVFAMAFLVAGIGGIVTSSGASSIGANSDAVAALWLDSVQALVWVAGFSCGAIGLFLSHRPSRRYMTP